MKAIPNHQAPIPMLLNERTLPKYHLRHDVLLDCLCHLYGAQFFDVFHDWIRLGKVRAVRLDASTGFPVWDIFHLHIQMEDLFFEFLQEQYNFNPSEEERVNDFLRYDI